jgi:hypothetical protein
LPAADVLCTHIDGASPAPLIDRPFLICSTAMNRLRRSLAILLVPILAAGLVLAGCSDDAPALSSDTKAAMDVLPASSDMVGMVDVQHVRTNSDAAQRFFDRFTQEMAESPEAQEALDAMNIDIESDIQRIYAGGSFRNDVQKPIILVYGSFDRDAINERMRQEAETGDSDLLATDIRGRTAFRVPDNDQDFVGVVVDESLIALGSAPVVEDALARLDGEGSGSLADATDRADLIREAARGKSMWAALMTVPEEMRGAGPNEMQKITSLAQSGAASFSFLDSGALDTRLTIQAADAKTASDLADVMSGLVGLGKRQVRDSNAMQESEDMQSVLESMEVSSSNNRVLVTGQIPGSMIDRQVDNRQQASLRR